jgi:FkbM family methyltransferase
VEAPRVLKDLVYPTHGDLLQLRFRERDWITAFVPDDEVFGLARELVLQRIYDRFDAGSYRLVVDAGAHVGLFSLIAAQRAVRVVALEPNPINFGVLEVNRRLNDARNLTALEAALWKTSGHVQFGASWHSTGGAVADTGDQTVTATSLDELVSAHGEIDLLKLDIEGAEFEVLGATEALDHVGQIVAELHFRDPAAGQQLVEQLRSRGFDVTLVPASSLYRASHVPTVLRNWRRLRGHLRVKLGVVAYLLAPVDKPRRPPGSRDMPLLVARRR